MRGTGEGSGGGIAPRGLSRGRLAEIAGWALCIATFTQSFMRIVGTNIAKISIRFAWGRARLPREEDWDKPFKLTRRNGGDKSLPVAHTCFFQVEMPEYSSQEKAKKALDIAVNFGIGTFEIG